MFRLPEMVNWQPIRQTSRLEGSVQTSTAHLSFQDGKVWQQVHDSLDGGVPWRHHVM